MNADQLLANYERVAGAPDAVQRLRSFVVDLAVRGKLVPQDPSEEDAAPLLISIKQAWDGRTASGKVKKPKVWNAVGISDAPFDVPNNWALVRLGQAMDLINGRAFKPSDWTPEGMPIVRIQNLNNPTAAFNRYDGDVKNQFFIDTGDFLISWSGTPGTSFGAHIWDRGPAVLNQHIFKAVLIGNAFAPHFLKLAINSRLLEMIEQAHGGVGLQHITKPKLEAVVITLPPLAEQHRIVAKVDELMVLCAQLEAARAEREATRNHLMAMSLAQLNTPDTDPAVFQSHVVFTLENLGHVTARPGQIKAFRQTILNLAVRGKLLPQDPNDEPASELLKEIAAEKPRLTKTTGIKKPWPESPVSPNDTSFSLPSGWAWSTIGWISSKTGSGSTPRGGKEAYKPSGVAFLRSQNIYDDGLRLNDVAYIDRATHERMMSTAIEASDLLLNITGGSMGRCCLVPDDLGEANISQHVAIIRPAIKDTARFFHSWVLSPYFQAFIFDEQTGAGRGGLPKNRMDRIPVALPPLTEQYRIVAKVDELMALCDQLEAMLSIGDDTRRRLLDALLHEALEPTNPTRNNLVPNRNSEALEVSMSIG